MNVVVVVVFFLLLFSPDQSCTLELARTRVRVAAPRGRCRCAEVVNLFETRPRRLHAWRCRSRRQRVEHVNRYTSIPRVLGASTRSRREKNLRSNSFAARARPWANVWESIAQQVGETQQCKLLNFSDFQMRKTDFTSCHVEVGRNCKNYLRDNTSKRGRKCEFHDLARLCLGGTRELSA